jgi:hypothetical protein
MGGEFGEHVKSKGVTTPGLLDKDREAVQDGPRQPSKVPDIHSIEKVEEQLRYLVPLLRKELWDLAVKRLHERIEFLKGNSDSDYLHDCLDYRKAELLANELCITRIKDLQKTSEDELLGLDQGGPALVQSVRLLMKANGMNLKKRRQK